MIQKEYQINTDIQTVSKHYATMDTLAITMQTNNMLSDIIDANWYVKMNTVLLGHTNLKTINDFYLSANHTKGSQVANTAIDKLVSNKIQ